MVICRNKLIFLGLVLLVQIVAIALNCMIYPGDASFQLLAGKKQLLQMELLVGIHAAGC